MSYLFYKAIIYKDKVHRPLGDDERLSTDSIPVSTLTANSIRALPDGLYSGTAMPQSAYYVSSTGSDVPTAGTKAAPFLTLDYCLQQVAKQYDLNVPVPGTSLRGSPVIALKAGETFPLNQNWNIYDTVTLTFWGDAVYGDFDSPLVGSPGTLPAVMLDLNRPVIAPAVDPTTNNGIRHFLAVESQTSTPPTLKLSGVRVDLPVGTVQNSDYCDFFIVFYAQSGRLQLQGAIINRLDANSSYGAMGVHGRARISQLENYASQFWIAGAPVQAGASTDNLLARKWFIKFYPDLAGNNQASGNLLGGSPGTGMIQLTWSDVPAAPVLPGKTNLPTFPVIGDAGFGIANYFYNLTRDNQGRPLNCLSPYLF